MHACSFELTGFKQDGVHAARLPDFSHARFRGLSKSKVAEKKERTAREESWRWRAETYAKTLRKTWQNNRGNCGNIYGKVADNAETFAEPNVENTFCGRNYLHHAAQSGTDEKIVGFRLVLHFSHPQVFPHFENFPENVSTFSTTFLPQIFLHLPQVSPQMFPRFPQPFPRPGNLSVLSLIRAAADVSFQGQTFVHGVLAFSFRVLSSRLFFFSGWGGRGGLGILPFARRVPQTGQKIRRLRATIHVVRIRRRPARQ